MAIFLTPEEILDLTAEAVRILHEKDCKNPKYLFGLAQNAVLEPHRLRDVDKLGRNQYEWLYIRASEQKNKEVEAERARKQEVAELRQKSEKAMKVHGLLEGLVRELGLETSAQAQERQDQLDERLDDTDGRLSVIGELVRQLVDHVAPVDHVVPVEAPRILSHDESVEAS